ncbi:MAG: HAD family hydrolase [Phototrophicaceae bacterium]
MSITTVIFDMDGVLVDSEIYWQQAREDFAHEMGKVWTLDDQRLAMGRSTVGWAGVMQTRLASPLSVEEIIADMKQRVKAKYAERLPTREGALEAVHRLATRYRVGLASGSPTEIIEHVMQLTQLDQVFEVIVYGDTIPNGKPAPDIYQEALRRLNTDPAQAVGIEDSANGIRSLHAAGMKIIATPMAEFPLPPDIQGLAHHTLTTLEGLTLELIEGLA